MSDQHTLLPIEDFVRSREEVFSNSLKDIFVDWFNWFIVNPRGDGNCLLYCLATHLIETPDGDGLDTLLLLFLKGIKLLLEEEETLFFDGEDEIVQFNRTDDDEMIVLKYLSLTQGQNITNSIIRVFARATNTNFVLVSYDYTSTHPLLIHIINVPNSYTIVDGNMLEDLPKYRFILSEFGHNFALFPQHYQVSYEAFANFERLAMMQIQYL